MSGDYPFLFTWTAQDHARPVHVTGGDGVHFTVAGADGGDERWLDLASLSYQANLGHSEVRIADAIAAQARALPVASPSAVFPAKVELARALLELAPAGFDKVFFTLGGAEAVENALKIAKLTSGRHGFVARERSYHGATMGALSVTGDHRRAPLLPLLPGVTHTGESAADIERALADRPGEVAAVILETVPGANGVVLPAPDFLPRVRAACDAAGALLILDEVLTGFGRIGTTFGFERFSGEPDLVTIAKGLTGGYAPLGAVLVHERISARFSRDTLWAGLTNYAHPVSCAAAREAVAIYRERGLLTRAADIEDDFAAALAGVRAAASSAVTDVRSIGLLGAIELSLTDDQWSALSAELDARRVYTHFYPSRGTVVLSPPLIIDLDTLAAGVGEVAAAIGAVAG